MFAEFDPGLPAQCLVKRHVHSRRAMMTRAPKHRIEIMEVRGAEKTGSDIGRLDTAVRKRPASVALLRNGRQDYSMPGGFAIMNIPACTLWVRSRIKFRRQVYLT
ncbi:hypothetical protein [Dyella agri]|uniref:Uncharacterized protein n=1 Tax=Dyella agri TaxID=1926869 RepID=A0ABW8KEK6_9GAMM